MEIPVSRYFREDDPIPVDFDFKEKVEKEFAGGKKKIKKKTKKKKGDDDEDKKK